VLRNVELYILYRPLSAGSLAILLRSLCGGQIHMTGTHILWTLPPSAGRFASSIYPPVYCYLGSQSSLAGSPSSLYDGSQHSFQRFYKSDPLSHGCALNSADSDLYEGFSRKTPSALYTIMPTLCLPMLLHSCCSACCPPVRAECSRCWQSTIVACSSNTECFQQNCLRFSLFFHEGFL
jgi:hypothetical protein